MSTTNAEPHVLILAGVGGISLDYVLDSARTVTHRLSIVYLHAWAAVDTSKTMAAWRSDFAGTWSDCTTLADLYHAVRAIHAADPLDGITTYSELLIQPHAELADELGLPGNPPQAVRTAQNKLLQRTVMRDSGALPLRFQAIRCRDDLAIAAEAVGFPAVFKPAYGAGSMQVSKVSSMAELVSAYERAAAAAAHSPFLIREDLYLLEELLTGDSSLVAKNRADYCSVESLLQGGLVHHLAVVDKLALRHGYVEEGHLLPSVLPTALQEEVKRHATKIINVVGLREGAVHTEIKITPDGPRCIEVNARLGGPMGHMFKAATDHDIVASILRIAAGLPVDPAVHVKRAVCFRSVPGPARPMRVVHFSEPAVLRERFDCLRYIRLRYAQGTVIDPHRFSHVATLLVTGQDAADCLRNVTSVEQALGVVLKPADREHVLVLDRVGYDRYRTPDGGPVLDPARYRVTLVTRPDLVSQARPWECAEVLGVDLWNTALRDGLCEVLHRDVGFDRLLVFTEQLLLPGARLRERLGIPGPALAAVLPFRDKSVMKETAAASGLPVADWLAVNRADEARRLLDKHGRIVLKPRFGSGSTGIHVVNSPADLAALDDRELVDYAAEEYVDGEMLHIDAAVYHGELRTCVVSRYLTSTLSHVHGRPLISVTVGDQGLADAATEFTRRVVDVFSVHNSVLHLELFHLADGSFVFNEVAARNGGGGVVPAVRAITGVNLYEAMVRLALDERPTADYPRTHPAAGWFLWYGRKGRLIAVDDEAVRQDWLIARRIEAEAGQQVTPSGFSGTGLVTYAVGGKDEAQVRKRLRFVEANSRVCYDNDGG
ncbi:MAG: ATP-grasp domain-containing protein [Pseudonocardiaceae bacterium]